MENKTKFNWKLPFYGAAGFAFGSIVLIAITLFLEGVMGGYTTGAIALVSFAAWGAIGGASLGIGLFGFENKIKILYLTFAGMVGLPLGFASAVFLSGYLQGGGPHNIFPQIAVGFAFWLAISGMFIGLGMKNMRYTIYLLFAGAVIGIILGVITGGVGISGGTGTAAGKGMPWFIHFIISGIIIGFSYGLVIAHATRKSADEDKDPKKWLFVVAVVAGLAVVLIINIFFPPEITEVGSGSYGKIITTNSFYVNMQYLPHAGFHPYTYIEYEKDGRMFEYIFYDQSMRLSLEWIKQNTEDDSIFLNWWDYGHHIRGYTNRDSIIYAPSADILRTTARQTWNPKSGDFSPHDRVIDTGYALLTSNSNETLRIMDKYNANYIYVQYSDLGKSWAIYEAVKDDVGGKLTFDASNSWQPQVTNEEIDEIQETIKDEDERNKLMSELYRKRQLEMLENTTLEKALNKKEIEGLELVYFDKTSVIYKRI